MQDERGSELPQLLNDRRLSFSYPRIPEYSYESVFRYLKSGMSNLIDEDADYLENYVLYAGVGDIPCGRSHFTGDSRIKTWQR